MIQLRVVIVNVQRQLTSNVV